MPVSSKRHNALRRLAFVLMLMAAWPAAQAEFRVAELRAQFNGDTLALAGHLELGLTPKVEEAVSKGIELPVIVELRLYRKRALPWDERLGTWVYRRSLRYHALSGQYLVDTGDTRESLLSATEALRYLGSLNELRLPLGELHISADDDYVIKLRAHLDIEALPAPLRPVAYTTPSWHLNSGWTAWTISHSAD